LRAEQAKRSRRDGGGGHQEGHSRGGTHDRGANAGKPVSCKSADEGLCVGLERGGRELRDGITGGEYAGARPGVCGKRTGRSSLPAGTEYIFTFLGDAGGDESVPAPAPPA